MTSLCSTIFRPGMRTRWRAARPSYAAASRMPRRYSTRRSTACCISPRDHWSASPWPIPGCTGDGMSQSAWRCEMRCAPTVSLASSSPPRPPRTGAASRCPRGRVSVVVFISADEARLASAAAITASSASARGCVSGNSRDRPGSARPRRDCKRSAGPLRSAKFSAYRRLTLALWPTLPPCDRTLRLPHPSRGDAASAPGVGVDCRASLVRDGRERQPPTVNPSPARPLQGQALLAHVSPYRPASGCHWCRRGPSFQRWQTSRGVSRRRHRRVVSRALVAGSPVVASERRVAELATTRSAADRDAVNGAVAGAVAGRWRGRAWTAPFELRARGVGCGWCGAACDVAWRSHRRRPPGFTCTGD
jgi:hypothetical protein